MELGDGPMDKESLLRTCDAEEVELLLLEEEQEREVPVMSLLASGVRVMGVAAFVETFCQRIPPAEVDAAWLTKLNLRQRRSHRPKGQAVERPFIGLPWLGPLSSHFVARQPSHPPRFGFSYIFSSNKDWLSWPPLHSVQVAHHEARCRRGRGSVGSGAGQAGDLCGPLSAQD